MQRYLISKEEHRLWSQGTVGSKIQSLGDSKSLGKFLLPVECWFPSQNQYENYTGSPRMGF